jgi:AraC-like DNA-binding protein
MMSEKVAGGEFVKFWVAPQQPGIELLRAKYMTQNFSRHTHEGYALGVIEQGALAFSYRGEHLVAPAGTVNLVIPGEAHDGQAATPVGWSYRMFYLAPDLLEQVAAEIFGQARRPFFSAGVIRDPDLASQISVVHRLLEKQTAMKLEQESRVLSLLSMFVTRYAEHRGEPLCARQEARAVKLAQEYIEAHYNATISLQVLARVCHLSSFYLIRVFRKHFGVPPHVFQKQVRIRRAKEYLARGCQPAFVALETGFVDQSHFSRQFKQITGLTPGQYSNSVQYDS